MQESDGCSGVVEPENIIEHVKASLWCRHQVKHLEAHKSQTWFVLVSEQDQKYPNKSNNSHERMFDTSQIYQPNQNPNDLIVPN